MGLQAAQRLFSPAKKIDFPHRINRAVDTVVNSGPPLSWMPEFSKKVGNF